MGSEKKMFLECVEYREKKAKNAVILLHGYGADAHDLAPLRRALAPREAVDWYFPQGPLKVPIGPMMSGRAWLPIEDRDWDSFLKGKIEDSGFSEGAENTLKMLVEFVNNLLVQYENVILGGFSQGAIATSHLFHRTEKPLRGLLLLSGYLFHPSQFPKPKAESSLPFFQSHGEQDAVLPVKGARQLCEQLKKIGLRGRLETFQGGHEIPPSVIEGARLFIQEQLE